MFASIAILSPPWSALDYKLPDVFPSSFWQPGLRVIVPVARSLRVGVILSTSSTSAVDSEICKPVLWPLERQPLIAADILDLALKLAAHQATTPGFVLGHLLPVGLRNGKLKMRWHRGTGRQITTAMIHRLPPEDYAALARDFIDGAVDTGEGGRADEAEEMIFLAQDPPWPLRPAAKTQRAVLELLYERGSLSRRFLLRTLGASAAESLKRLIALQLVRIELSDAPGHGPDLPPPDMPSFDLSEAQKAALTGLQDAFAKGERCRLIYGITGSGKTAVYLEFARWLLERGHSVLLLAPEVALAHKLFRDVELALPEATKFLYHGYQTPAQRDRTYRQLGNLASPAIVVGTRSAVFLPMPKPGAIIMDEEHDSSYKQTENLVYHAKDMAWTRMANRGLLILGSATPDLRTFYASENKVMPRLTLGARVGAAAPPPVELVRIGAAAGKDGLGLLAQSSESALRECLEKGEQAIVLLNRRGYAPLVWCATCNQVVKCPHCQIGMAYHKQSGRMACHFCGHNIPWPSPCPQCGDTSFVAMGEGTERLAERLEALAGRPVLRLDRDSARHPGKIDEILTAFGRGESPFLVGTQMLSKGHHFPNVTLAIVADSDIGLNLPDYRAAERTFQLLVQGAGRAGRGAKPGKAIIQTRNPDHYCWRPMMNYDYEGFYAAELERRRKLRYPPFVRLGLLRFSFPVDDDEAMALCRALGRELKTHARNVNVDFYGPVPAPLAILQGRRRMHCMMKGEGWEPMRQLWFFANQKNNCKTLRLTLDLDPVDMM